MLSSDVLVEVLIHFKSRKEGQMAIRVFIKRICEDPSKEKELFSLVRELRSLVPQQPGYLSSKYVKKTDHPKDIVAISTWDSTAINRQNICYCMLDWRYPDFIKIRITYMYYLENCDNCKLSDIENPTN